VLSHVNCCVFPRLVPLRSVIRKAPFRDVDCIRRESCSLRKNFSHPVAFRIDFIDVIISDIIAILGTDRFID